MKKLLFTIERGRSVTLSFGYRFVEWKSKIKKSLKETYLFSDSTTNYQNITLKAVEGQRGNSLFDCSGCDDLQS